MRELNPDRPNEVEAGAGISRFQFLTLLAGAGASAILTACEPKIMPLPAPTPQPMPVQQQQTFLLSFDGISSFVNIPDAPILRVDSFFSVEAWVQPEIQPVDYTKLVMKNSVAYDWFLGMDTLVYQTFAFGVYNTLLENHKVRSLAKFTPGQLYHLLGTFNGTNTEFFLDGISQGKNAFTGTRPALTSDITFGCQNQIGLIYRFFKGLIGQVRLYDRVLDNVEALTNFKRGLKAPPSNPTGLVGWWPCNEGTGSPLDYSGHGNNGVVTGATWVRESSEQAGT